LIAFHFMFDTFAQLTSSDILNKEVLAVSILNIIYLIYGCYLVVVLLRKKKMNIETNQVTV